MASPERITPQAPAEDANGGRPLSIEASAVDWDHLSRQTFGDRELEKELLTLFSTQAASFVARLDDSAEDAAGRRRIAHTLQGSARAIGAFDLANAAQEYESALTGAAGECAARRDELSRRLDAAQTAIAARLERF